MRPSRCEKSKFAYFIEKVALDCSHHLFENYPITPLALNSSSFAGEIIRPKIV